MFCFFQDFFLLNLVEIKNEKFSLVLHNFFFCFFEFNLIWETLFLGTKEDLPPGLAPAKPYDQQGGPPRNLSA